MRSTEHVKRGQQKLVCDEFFDNFDIKIPEPEELEEAFKLRHKVFCQQLGYFAQAERNFSNLENDEFDHTAMHCVVLDKKLNKVIGCIRLVNPNPSNKLPFSEYITDYPIAKTDKEISRLVVCPKYRNRLSDLNIQVLIFNALFLSVNVIAEKIGLNSALIFIERKMARALKQFGFRLTEMTDSVELTLSNNKVSSRCLYKVDLIQSEELRHNRSKSFIKQIKYALYPEYHHYFRVPKQEQNISVFG
ncbi:GNAT family N-acetyltransferase [Catenovulum sp. 2E275]|uniref:acyl-homoserine-lactone synthase n=1 Tax=Catenovulum sp. 2E275 TaxID=2980497 RepID=UPI0021CFEFAA|nr:GNAT family N-acyltransferase [Catenovulum sp. 2E275]MCU4676856.1 GNAT family N-acetyltransferase [Catenovulum sp. 2E275]